MDYTPIFQALISVLALVITGFIVPFLKTKIGVQNQEKIKSYIKTAVSAAEQIFTKSGSGEDKKRYVIDYLEKQGVKITEYELDALIESTVQYLTK